MAKAAATKNESSNPVAPLFAEISPIVHADDIGEIKIFRAIMRGGNPKRGKQVNFGDDEYIEANEGEEFELSPYETTELDLARVLKAARPDLYWAQAYDKTGVIIQRAGRIVDATEDDEGAEEPEPEAPTDAAGINAIMMKEFMGFLREKDRRNAREPLNAIDMATKLAGAITTKEDPNAIIVTLQEEIRGMRASHTTEIAEIRRKAGIDVDEARRKANIEIDEARGEKRREVDLVTDRLRKAEERYDRDRDGWVNERRSIDDRYSSELRSTREKHDRELSELRVEMSNKIHALEAKNIDLQSKYGTELMRAERALMTTELDKRLAEREVADANNVIQTIQGQAEEMQKQLAASGGEGLIQQGVTALPAIEKIVKMFKGDNSPSKGKMGLQDMVSALADNPGIIEELRSNPEMLRQVQEMFGGAPPRQQPPAQQWSQNAEAQAQAAMEQQMRAETEAREAAERVEAQRRAEAQARAAQAQQPPPPPPPPNEEEEEEEEEDDDDEGTEGDEKE